MNPSIGKCNVFYGHVVDIILATKTILGKKLHMHRCNAIK